MPSSPQRHGFTSPLRYPGGKGAIGNFIKIILCQNNLLDGYYIEVYAGGAGIVWPLLFEEYVQRVYINDISKSLFAFWKSVLEDTETLCKLISDISVTIEEWNRQKNIQTKPEDHTLTEFGFSTFFLNRTNRSGILQGGIIGGKTQNGTWKLDARFNKKDLIERIERIARYSNRISLYNLDASRFIEKILPGLPQKALVYLDPPYYVKGQELYENHYSPDDHVKLASLVSKKIIQPWIVSYDTAPKIMELYSGYRSIKYTLSYSAQGRYAGSEIMFFSENLSIPLIEHPALVSKENLLLPLRKVLRAHPTA
jgi:DNA adenine methylase